MGKFFDILMVVLWVTGFIFLFISPIITYACWAAPAGAYGGHAIAKLMFGTYS